MESYLGKQCQLPTSEMKNKKTHQKSFTDALREKYRSVDEDCNFIVDGVFINLVVSRSPSKNGSDAEFAHLRNVVLSQYEVDHAGIPDRGLSTLCPNVIDLDLSSNLLACWSEILPLLAQLPTLKFVNLSHNKIKNNNNYIQEWQITFPTIENFVLNSTNVKWGDVLHLCQHLPALKDLHLCQNGFTILDCTHLDKLQRVESIWMNNNDISCWSEIWKLRNLVNLKSLVLSSNPIENLFYQEESPDQSNTPETPARQQNLPETPVKQDHSSEDFSQIKTRSKVLNVRRKLQMSDILPCESYLDVLDHIAEECCSPSKNNPDCDIRFYKTLPQSSSPFSSHTKLAHNDNNNKKQADSRPIDINYKYSSYNDISHGSPKQECEELMEDSSCNSPQYDDSGCGSSISSNFMICDADFLCDQKMDTNRRPFEKLKSLCLSKTAVSDWDQVYQLNKFPGLHSLRLMDIPFLTELESEERRTIIIASLSNVSYLNGSEVTVNEKEKAERYFLRYYGERLDKPCWFYELEAKHGKLKPLLDIDLGARYHAWANIVFIYNGMEIFTEKLHVVQPVGKLRKHIAKCLSLPLNGFKMFHYPCSPEHGNLESVELQELRLDSLPMSRFDLLDKDEIHIDDSSLLSLSV